MELDISTIMMTLFIVSLVLSIWKIYAFLPNKQLKDDDTTPEAQMNLQKIMIDVIVKHSGKISQKDLFEKMKQHQMFEEEKYWRFNLNKLKQLLHVYYLQNQNISTIEDIYHHNKKKIIVNPS